MGNDTQLFIKIFMELDVRKRHNIKTALYNGLKNEFFSGKENPSISDLLDKKLPSFRRSINKRIKHSQKTYGFSRFEWSIDDDYEIVGCAYPLPDDDIAKQEHKTKEGISFVLENILKKLSPENFELLCKRMLDQYGCSYSSNTRPSKDGGIDFYGTISGVLQNNNMLINNVDLHSDSKLHIIGQAKRYDNKLPIRTHNIREFLGSALLLEFSQGWNNAKDLSIKNLPEKYLKPKDPVILVFITTSYATTDARSLAVSLGMQLLDGTQIARWLSFHVLEDLHEDQVQLENVLHEWINVSSCS